MQLRVSLVLASGSPRRKCLLESLGMRFEVRPSGVEEFEPPGLAPAALVEHLAESKAAAVAPHHPDALVLAADTLVAFEGDVLGQPDSPDAARHLLQRLSGQRHDVYTGLTLTHRASRRQATAHAKTSVTFAALTPAEIDAYVATGSPMDKAGAYGIQDRGALFVERIEGDYYNVVGLPLRRFYVMLQEQFADLLAL